MEPVTLETLQSFLVRLGERLPGAGTLYLLGGFSARQRPQPLRPPRPAPDLRLPAHQDDQRRGQAGEIDPVWQQSAVLEPLEEAGIEVEREEYRAGRRRVGPGGELTRTLTRRKGAEWQRSWSTSSRTGRRCGLP